MWLNDEEIFNLYNTMDQTAKENLKELYICGLIEKENNELTGDEKKILYNVIKNTYERLGEREITLEEIANGIISNYKNKEVTLDVLEYADEGDILDCFIGGNDFKGLQEDYEEEIGQ